MRRDTLIIPACRILFSLHTHGFIRAAVASPRVAVADPAFNVARTIEMARDALERGASLVLFPELGLSAYAIDDLLQQDALLDAVEAALADMLAASRALPAARRRRAAAPSRAALQLRGRDPSRPLLGVVPKAYLPNYREFYEPRHFASGAGVAVSEIAVARPDGARSAPICCSPRSDCRRASSLHAEICEDVWVPVPPSSRAALAGATVLLNLSASNVTSASRITAPTLCAAHSARCLAAYLYAAAGQGESTTDLAWDGQAMIYENGDLLAETAALSRRPAARRRRYRSRSPAPGAHAAGHLRRLRRRRAPARTHSAASPSRSMPPRDGDLGLMRAVARFPFVPADEARLAELCFEAYNIQVAGLAQAAARDGHRARS